MFADLSKEDKETVCLVASEHRLGRLLYFNCRKDIPEPWAEQFALEFRNASALELKRSVELKSIFKLLSDNGIYAAPLKGAYLANAAYPHPALRIMCDTDILIREVDINKAWKIMLAKNFKPTNELKHSYHKPMLRSSMGNAIELHYHITSSQRHPERKLFPAETLWKNSQLHEFHSSKAIFLSPEITLLHAIDHAFNDNLVCGFKVFVDSAFIISRLRPDSDKLQKLAEETGFFNELKLLMNVFPDFFPKEYSIEISKEDNIIVKSVKFLILNQTQLSKYENYQRGFQSEFVGKKISEKLFFALKWITRSPSRVAYKYKCNKYSPKMVYFYGSHICDGIRKYFDSNSLSSKDIFLQQTGECNRNIQNYLERSS